MDNTVGIAQMSLWAVRKILEFLPNVFNFLMSFSGGLISQILVIIFLVKIVPIFADIFEKLVKAFIWFMHKFE